MILSPGKSEWEGENGSERTSSPGSSKACVMAKMASVAPTEVVTCEGEKNGCTNYKKKDHSASKYSFANPTWLWECLPQ